jgi:hypothetical protein
MSIHMVRHSSGGCTGELISVAALVGRISAVDVLSKIKTNLERSEHPEAKSSMRKAKPSPRL